MYSDDNQCTNCGAISQYAVCPQCGNTKWRSKSPEATPDKPETPTFQEKYAITEEEKEAVIQLVAERYRNYVYIEAENSVRELVNRTCVQHDVRNDDVLSLTFSVSQVVADVLVELGAVRRGADV